MTVVQLPDGHHVYADPTHLSAQQPSGPQVVHIHQALPDRTVQRVALGSGVGAGAVAAGVYFGPLLVGALTAIAANLAMLAFIALVLGWAVVTVVRAVGDSTKRTGRRGRKAR
ncbi:MULTISPECIES: DUF6251 family protein [unclassified Streptomyces]|uniref:DUF6251 family protein n=1 Tax=unclassified Streptomyces TaxID=2593676 RepID=UPI001F322A56|nr:MULTISPECIES: DUF6251 family protein [unclassified Streptomyces]